MNMEYNKIGENAGIVWRALNTQKYSWEYPIQAMWLTLKAPA